LIDATSSIKFAIPQMLLRSAALRLCGGNFGAIPGFECPPAKGAHDGSRHNDDAHDDLPERGQNGFAALTLPPDESRRTDARKSEEESQDWPSQRPDGTVARRLSTE
jgi:hypothetical protein